MQSATIEIYAILRNYYFISRYLSSSVCLAMGQGSLISIDYQLSHGYMVRSYQFSHSRDDIIIIIVMSKLAQRARVIRIYKLIAR